VAFNAYNPVPTSTFPQKYSPVDHKDYKRVGKRPNQESANTDPAGWSGDEGDDVKTIAYLWRLSGITKQICLDAPDSMT